MNVKAYLHISLLPEPSIPPKITKNHWINSDQSLISQPERGGFLALCEMAGGEDYFLAANRYDDTQGMGRRMGVKKPARGGQVTVVNLFVPCCKLIGASLETYRLGLHTHGGTG